MRFRPKGEIPEWMIVYERLQPLEFGDVITYRELGELLRYDDRKERTRIYGPVGRAMREFEKERKRTLEVVRTVGYRVVHAEEHVRLANGHARRARRQVRRGSERVASADRSHLTQEDRRRLDDTAARLDRIEVLMGSKVDRSEFEERVGRLEVDVRTIQEQS